MCELCRHQVKKEFDRWFVAHGDYMYPHSYHSLELATKDCEVIEKEFEHTAHFEEREQQDELRRMDKEQRDRGY